MFLNWFGGRILWCLIGCNVVAGCTKPHYDLYDYPSKVGIKVLDYELEKSVITHVEFSVKNIHTRSICLYRSVFESDRTVQIGLFLKRSSGQFLKPNPVGYLAEYPTGTIVLLPQESRLASLSVKGWYPPTNEKNLQANIRLLGSFCEQETGRIVAPDFTIESGWFPLKDR